MNRPLPAPADRRCPWPDCGEHKRFPDSLFCSAHYWLIDTADLHALQRLQARAKREPDEETRRHLTEQLPGYVNAAIKRAMEGKRVA